MFPGHNTVTAMKSDKEVHQHLMETPQSFFVQLRFTFQILANSTAKRINFGVKIHCIYDIFSLLEKSPLSLIAVFFSHILFEFFATIVWEMLENIKMSRANNTNSVAEEEKDVLP